MFDPVGKTFDDIALGREHGTRYGAIDRREHNERVLDAWEEGRATATAVLVTVFALGVAVGAGLVVWWG